LLRLTQLDGQPFLLNPDCLVMVESTPDTLLRLSNGEKWLVKESAALVEAQFLEYKQRIYALFQAPQGPA
jgi:flagellar protein FlbD